MFELSLEHRIGIGYFPELGERIQERRETLGYSKAGLGRLLAPFMSSCFGWKISPISGAGIIYNVECGKMFANGYMGKDKHPNAPRDYNKKSQLNGKTSVYLTALEFEDNDNVIITLRRYYDYFEYPNSQRPRILDSIANLRNP